MQGVCWECGGGGGGGMSPFASPDVPAGLGMLLLLVVLVPPDTPFAPQMLADKTTHQATPSC